jgi:hypothetical protein
LDNNKDGKLENKKACYQLFKEQKWLLQRHGSDLEHKDGGSALGLNVCHCRTFQTERGKSLSQLLPEKNKIISENFKKYE